jgi:hypothetical protein
MSAAIRAIVSRTGRARRDVGLKLVVPIEDGS